MPIYKIFEGLNDAEIARIWDLGVIRPFDAGEVIFRKGDKSNAMFLILTGTIVIADSIGKNVDVIAKLGPGEILGETAIYERAGKRSAHAIAREASQALVLNTDTLLDLLETEIPKRFLVNIIGLLSQRLRITNTLLMRSRHAGDDSPSTAG
jgi:CRP/FNR family cyclic AMP-dependent transcriptional regulator